MVIGIAIAFWYNIETKRGFSRYREVSFFWSNQWC